MLQFFSLSFLQLAEEDYARSTLPDNSLLEDITTEMNMDGENPDS